MVRTKCDKVQSSEERRYDCLTIESCKAKVAKRKQCTNWKMNENQNILIQIIMHPKFHVIAEDRTTKKIHGYG